MDTRFLETMINKIKDILKTSDNKRIFSNFLSLSVLQGANLILPLVTFPYLVQVLGIEKYGLVAFAQALIAYFSTLTEYGFNLTGTREISIFKNNQTQLIKRFNSIQQARIFLVVLGFLLMTIIVFSFQKFQNDWQLYFLTYGVVVGTAMFPTWFFQGIQKMKFITILSVISKTIFTISIFFLVKSPEDYLWVPASQALGGVFVAVISLILINRKFKIPFKYQKFKYVLQQYKKGGYVFMSSISINLYSATTTFVLGLFTNNTMVGYYSIANRVVKIIVSLFTPFYQAIYPHVIQLSKKSYLETINLIRKILKFSLIISFLVLGCGIVLAEPMFKLVFGEDVEHSILLFKILSPLIIVLPIAYVLFNITLLTFKMDKYFLRIYITGAILNIFLLTLFLYILDLSTIGAAFALLICESSLTIYAAILLHKHKINVFPFLHSKTIYNKTF